MKLKYLDIGCTITCFNGGTCYIDSNGLSRCSCPFGFTGTYCESSDRGSYFSLYLDLNI